MNVKKLEQAFIILFILFIGVFTSTIYSEYIDGLTIPNVLALNLQKPLPSPTPIPTPTPKPQIIPGEPVLLSIPKINVQANIESVGLDVQGKMDVPKDDFNAAWYNLGFKPGQNGSAVLAGHLDRVTGAPAIFWNLSKLEIGDEITVTDNKNQTFIFRVNDKQTYIYNKVPLEEIFAKSGEPVLNLITCGGSFNQAARNYTHRTIVQATLVNEE
jgi:LPXTG-site transpeptidase (sortase) family protein